MLYARISVILIICALYSGPIWGMLILKLNDPRAQKSRFRTWALLYYALLICTAFATYFLSELQLQTLLSLSMFALILLAVFSPILLFFAIDLTQPRKHDQPVCHACGYSLIGNESGICPECGSPHQRETKTNRPTLR